MTAETQPERTHLAWNRTALALLVVSAFFWRYWPSASHIVILPIAASTCSALAILVSQRRRYARLPLETNRADLAAPSILLTFGTITALALIAVITIAD